MAISDILLYSILLANMICLLLITDPDTFLTNHVYCIYRELSRRTFSKKFDLRRVEI